MSASPAELDVIVASLEFFRTIVSPTLVLAALAWLALK